MRNLYFLLLIGALIFSCKPKVKEHAEEAVTTYTIQQEKWPKKAPLNGKVTSDLEDWSEFVSLEASFDALSKVANTDDLALVIDDLIEKHTALVDSKFPERFDMPQIKGRLTLFKTFMLKVKGDLHYRLDVQKSTLEMINAYNAFRNQFNIIANNTLNTKLLLEE